MIYLFILLFRFTIYAFVAMATLTILALWALCWLIVFIVSFVYVAFDETRGPKRLAKPAMTRRRTVRENVGRSDASDAFGHPVPQSRWSNRR
jgi:hypothetical protein